MTSATLTRVLGFLGLVPFMLPSYLMANAALFGSGLQSAAIFGLYAPYVFIAYSAIILSFLGGHSLGSGPPSRRLIGAYDDSI